MLTLLSYDLFYRGIYRDHHGRLWLTESYISPDGKFDPLLRGITETSEETLPDGQQITQEFDDLNAIADFLRGLGGGDGKL